MFSRKILFLCFCSFLFSCSNNALQESNSQNIFLENVKSINVPEPSDIFLCSDGNYFIVSDKGFVYKLDSELKIIQKFSLKGQDFEGITVDEKNSFVYVTDERPRKIYRLSKDKDELISSFTISENGAANKGFEGIAIDETGNLLIVREKDATAILTVSSEGQKLSETTLNFASDLSSITIFNGKIYVLSDEEATLYQLNKDFTVRKKWSLPVVNPEGVTFKDENTVLILSDAEAKLYEFTLEDRDAFTIR